MISTANKIPPSQLSGKEDLKKVYGVVLEEISGYSKLSQENKDIFDAFIVNFYNASGLEARAEIIPLAINFVSEVHKLGKHQESDDYFVPLGGTVTAIYKDNRKKRLTSWKDKEYKNIPCTETEEETYLRFEYKRNGRKVWQHVISASRWG